MSRLAEAARAYVYSRGSSYPENIAITENELIAALAEHDASDGELVHDEAWLERQANALYDLEVYEIAVPSGIDIARDYAEHLHKRDTEKETSDD